MSGADTGRTADPFGAFVAFARDPVARAGPLAGLRAAIKDNIAVAGLPFTAGHPLFADRIGETDAPVVRRLRKAGARIIGVTRTDSGGFGVMTPEVGNPAAPGRTVGGSSGGSAAAVAAGLADIALGTDTAGSVRIPAACTGLIGFKPSRGRIPNDGVWPLSPSLDHVGVIGRNLDLIARTADVLLGSGPAARPLARPLRIGISRESLADCHEAVRAAFMRVVAVLEGEGMRVVQVDLPGRDRMLDAHRTILFAEAREVYRSLSPAQVERLAATARRSLPLADGITPEMVDAARRTARDIMSEVEALFEHVDLLMSPTICCPVPPPDARRVEIGGQMVPIVRAMIAHTALFNLSGHPAMALPSTQDHDGLPVSVQIAARAGADRSLFDGARALAPVLRLSARPPDERA